MEVTSLDGEQYSRRAILWGQASMRIQWSVQSLGRMSDPWVVLWTLFFPLLLSRTLWLMNSLHLSISTASRHSLLKFLFTKQTDDNLNDVVFGRVFVLFFLRNSIWQWFTDEIPSRHAYYVNSRINRGIRIWTSIYDCGHRVIHSHQSGVSIVSQSPDGKRSGRRQGIVSSPFISFPSITFKYKINHSQHHPCEGRTEPEPEPNSQVRPKITIV